MVFVTICVGSCCHIHGSEDIVELLKQEIERNGLEDEVIPVGGFCQQKCSRSGVTIQVDDDVFSGVSKETFKDFFRENIMTRVGQEG